MKITLKDGSTIEISATQGYVRLNIEKPATNAAPPDRVSRVSILIDANQEVGAVTQGILDAAKESRR